MQLIYIELICTTTATTTTTTTPIIIIIIIICNTIQCEICRVRSFGNLRFFEINKYKNDIV